MRAFMTNEGQKVLTFGYFCSLGLTSVAKIERSKSVANKKQSKGS